MSLKSSLLRTSKVNLKHLFRSNQSFYPFFIFFVNLISYITPEKSHQSNAVYAVHIFGVRKTEVSK